MHTVQFLDSTILPFTILPREIRSAKLLNKWIFEATLLQNVRAVSHTPYEFQSNNSMHTLN